MGNNDVATHEARRRYDTRHGVLTLFSLESYNLYSIASQLKRLFDPMTIGISWPGGAEACVSSYISRDIIWNRFFSFIIVQFMYKKWLMLHAKSFKNAQNETAIKECLELFFRTMCQMLLLILNTGDASDEEGNS